MKKPRRNPCSSVPGRSNSAGGLLRGALPQQLEADIRNGKGPASSQAPITQPTPNTDTPFSIGDLSPFSPGYPEVLPIEAHQPPATGGQLPSPSYSNIFPSPTFQLPASRQDHANGLMPRDSANMDPSNTHGYGYQPPNTTRSTSNVRYWTTNTFPYANTLPIEDGATQGQHNMNTLSLQSGDAQSTFYQDAQWQQPQPPLDTILPSFRIRGPNRRWIPVEVRWDPNIGPSYLMESAAVESGWPLTAFETFPPGNYSQSRTLDGLITPTDWVTVDMEDGTFGSQQTSVPIAIYPLPQPFWTSARLIIGQDLWQRLYGQQANASASTFGAPRH